jgi:uncharacterized membrane protein YdjX (TVP38/TMEM64 family)
MQMREFLFPIVLVAIVLAVPIVPFLSFGEELEGAIEAWLDESLPPATAAGMTVGLLAVDVFLPVPSSVVSTFAASVCGFWLGTGASWLGMTLGGVLGFLVARLFGRWAAVRLAKSGEVERLDRLSRRFGPFVVVLTRPIPVFAEATVLTLGTTALPWRRFLGPLMLSNLALAVVYSALGEWMPLPIAIAAAIVLPLLGLFVARRVWPV